MRKQTKAIFYTLSVIALVINFGALAVLLLFQDVVLAIAYAIWSVYILILALWVYVDSRIDL